jgi:hypothetical protein
MTYYVVGPPPPPPGYGHMTGPRDDITGQFSLSYVSPHPQVCLCMGGEGSLWAPPYPVCLGPGAISMKEDWVQEAPLHSHTQTSYAGTRVFMRHRAYMPATIAVACGLLSPMQWCGHRFSAAG